VTPEPQPPAARRREGRMPDAKLETTHFGPPLDEAVLRAKRRMRVGVDPDYDLLQQNFDVLHYVLQVPRVLERPRLDLVQHFLDTGVEHMRSPDINFSMAEYLQRYPDRANGPECSPYLEWLKHGQAAGEIADPAPAIPQMARVLGRSPEELVELLTERRTDLVQRLRTGELGEMVARATEIEPLIGHTLPRFTRPRLLPFGHPPALEQLSVIHAAHQAAGFRRARLVLVINRPRWGGGRRMEGHLAHALMSQIDADDVVVIYTDKSGTTPEGRFPAGVREIDFGALAKDLDDEDAEAALAILLRTFRSDAIVNINSATLYRAMRSFGPALTASERLFLCFFCSEQMPTGAWTGWSMRYFYRLFGMVTGVITDSHHLADVLQRAYHIPQRDRSRLHVLQAPVDRGLPVVPEAPTATQRRPQVFWAGRWDRQKRVGLFLQVARQMPDVDFRMWGEPVMSGHGRPIPPNVTMEGRYGHISDIPLHEADAWLYTSAWDGVPSQLLEVCVTGIPTVGTLVGGTGEILTPEESWPVEANERADAYVRALRSVLADPLEARRRAGALRKRLLAERTEEDFRENVTRLLLVPARGTEGGEA
jgi:glycosyltransferase involved in cell wall biosynthesis